MAIGDIPRDWYKTVKKSSSGSNTPKKEDSSAASNDAASSSQLTLPSDSASTWSAQPSALASPPSQSDAASSKDPSILGGSTLQASSGPMSSGRSTSPSGASSSQGGKPKKNLDVEAALGMGLDTGKNVSRIVETGFKSPMNFCMGLAKGFRNVPRLYNDDTIRKPDKVTGIGSGVVVAWKELGLGFYDGVSGLVTQPYKGAQKQGGQGFIKGVGKGIGGLILKPAAGKTIMSWPSRSPAILTLLCRNLVNTCLHDERRARRNQIQVPPQRGQIRGHLANTTGPRGSSHY